MSNTETSSKQSHAHWPVICLGFLVGFFFLVVLFVFEVKETEFAVVRRFGQPRTYDDTVRVYEPGLHFKWPLIDRVWRHDNRLLPYELTRGQVEQVQTRDGHQVVVTSFVFWRVGDPYRFLTAFNSTTEAENRMDGIIRNSRNSVLAEHNLSDLVNVNPEELKIREVEEKMLERVREALMREYGIEVSHLGIKHLGFPENVTTAVFERMTEERNRRIENYRSAGRELGERIRTTADLEAHRVIIEAEAEATRIRGEGDRLAAEQYAVFQEHPELAAFLRKLEALRRTLSGRTTLVIDTGTPPYDLLRPGALQLNLPPAPQAETESRQEKDQP